MHMQSHVACATSCLCCCAGFALPCLELLCCVNCLFNLGMIYYWFEHDQLFFSNVIGCCYFCVAPGQCHHRVSSYGAPLLLSVISSLPRDFKCCVVGVPANRQRLLCQCQPQECFCLLCSTGYCRLLLKGHNSSLLSLTKPLRSWQPFHQVITNLFRVRHS
jgi:hypothetical protein